MGWEGNHEVLVGKDLDIRGRHVFQGTTRHAFGDRGKTHKASYEIVGNLAYIRAGFLPSTSLERQSYTIPLNTEAL